MKDNIRGLYTESGIDDDGNEIAEKYYGVNIEGDDINKTNFYLHNDIYDANVSLSNTTINTINDETHTYNFHSLTLTGDTNLTADVDLANETMDRFSAKEYGNHTGNMNIVGMNLLSDSQGKRTEILFAEEGLKDYVTNTTDELPSTYQTAYVEYGLGLQRNWKDRFTAFGQAMLRNGGRNGISLTAGFRWALGKEGKGVNETEKVQRVNNPRVGHSEQSQPARKVLKQLTPAQRVALGAKPQNTTRTTNLGVLK